MIPYGRQCVEADDIAAVVKVLESDWLTQGPMVEEFERALADYCGVKFAVVTSNGTTALHTAYAAMGLASGDEIITSPITFPATTNAALWQSAHPVFVDVDASTGNIDVNKIRAKITSRTKALAPIDYTGRPAALNEINQLAKEFNLIVVEDACQALGARYHGKAIGSLSDLSVFSFHPVKSITTGEGGAVLTNNEDYYKKMKRFITHGVAKTDFINPSPGPWYFEMQMLGNNYRLTDIQCALGLSQLKKLDHFITLRRSIAERYHEAFKTVPQLIVPSLDSPEIQSAWHLYALRLAPELVHRRSEIFTSLRAKGIGVQVHHIPVHLHPYYQKLGYQKGQYPNAEAFYNAEISLPIYPTLVADDQAYVIKTVKESIEDESSGLS